MSAHPNRSILWGRVIVDALASAGVDAAIVCPGSRSTPLAFALAEREDVRTFSLVDERSAAFFALGRAKATNRPVAIVCTSGTAVANFHPAVIEAYYAGAPLVVVSADRPPALRDSGANQTIDQVHLFGRHVRAFTDLPLPAAREDALAQAWNATRRLVERATARPPGPVHLNVPFEKPLEPAFVPGDVPSDLRMPRSGATVPVRAWTPRVTPQDLEVDAVAARVADAPGGLIVCGPRPPADDAYREAVLALARATGYPVLADPLSGVRFGPDADGLVIGGYDALLSAGFQVAPPDLVIRFGAFPTSTALGDYLGRTRGATHVLVTEGDHWRDPLHRVTLSVDADAAPFARALAERVTAPAASPEWTARWRDAEGVAWKTLAERAQRDPFFEGVVPGVVLDALAGGGTLFTSSSLPVRDLDRFGAPRDAPVRVIGNRGASGIDGILSTGLGAATAREDPTVIVTGDLAFLHDVNGLLAVGREGVEATIVLVDNDGGGIFQTLPVSRYDPPFTRLFRTPVGVDHAHFARAFGVPFERVTDREGLRDALARRVGHGAGIVSVTSDAQTNAEEREAAARAVTRALTDAGVA